MQGLKTKSTFKTYPITWLLISINIFMFILETIFGGSITKSTLCLLGANCDIDISQGHNSVYEFLTYTTGTPTKEKAAIIDIDIINKNEEITFEYNTTESKLTNPFRCKCQGNLIKGKDV